MVKSEKEIESVLKQIPTFLARFRYMKINEQFIAPLPYSKDLFPLFKDTVKNCLSGDSQAIFFPFSESEFFVSGFIGVIAHSFVNDENHPNIAFVSTNKRMEEIYDRIQDEYGQKLRSWHPSAGLDPDGVLYTTHERRSFERYHRILFLQNEQLKYLKKAKDLDLIVLDITSEDSWKKYTLYVNQVLDIGKMLEKPILIFCGPTSHALVLNLSNQNFLVRSFPRFVFSSADKTARDCDNFSKDNKNQPKKDLDYYPTWLAKIFSFKAFPKIRTFTIEDDANISKLSEELLQLYDELKRNPASMKYTIDYGYAFLLESSFRMLAMPFNILERQFASNYGYLTVDERVKRFEIRANQIYESDPIIGYKFLELADSFREVTTNLYSRNVVKASYMLRILEGRIENSIGGLVVRTPAEKEAYKNYLEDKTPHSEILPRVYTLREFTRGERMDSAFFTGVPGGWLNSILSTTSARELLFLCYDRESINLSNRKRIFYRDYAFWVKKRSLGDRPQKLNFKPTQNTNGYDYGYAPNEEEFAAEFKVSVPTMDEIIKREKEENVNPVCRSYVQPGSYNPVKVVTKEGYITVPELRKFTVVRGKENFGVYAEDLMAGDLILVGRDMNPRPMADYVWELMDKILATGQDAAWRQWKSGLKDYFSKHPSEDYRSLFKKLKELGAEVETPSAVYIWVNDDDIIGPQKRASMNAIAKFVGKNEETAEEWWISVKQVRSTLNSLYLNIWKLAKASAKDLNSDSDIILNRKFDIRLSDIADRVILVEVLEVIRDGI